MFAREVDIATQASVLVLSRHQKVLDAINRVLSQAPSLEVSSELLSLADIGEAGGIFVTHTVIVFEANPADELELRRVQDVLAERTDKNIIVALTDNDLSLQKARELLDAGVDHVLPYSIKGEQFRSLLAKEVQDLTADKVMSAPAAGGSVIAVTKSRGGVGATTVAVNLAMGLMKLPNKPRVALIDLDMQFGNAGIFLDLEDNGGMRKLVETTEAPDAHFVQGIMQKHSSGLDVLCAPASIMPLQTLSAERVDGLISLLTAEYDYIVFDLPQALIEWVEPVLAHAGRLEVVMDTSVPCVRHVRRLLDFLEYEHFQPQVELIVNREKKPLIRSENIRQAEEILGRNIEHWLPDAPDVSRRAVDIGKPAVSSKPGSGLGRGFVRIAKSVQNTKPLTHDTEIGERA